MTEATRLEKPDYETASDEMRDLLDSLGVTVTCKFVPLSKSRNAGEKQPTVNWRATVRRVGTSNPNFSRDVLTCDYAQGVAHLKGWKHGYGRTVYEAEQIKKACEIAPKRGMYQSELRAVAPTREDVLGSLAMDSDVLDYATYAEWGPNLGYDADSRKGEAIYRACLEIALKLRAALGDAALTQLRELAGRF